jgi:hypothetical protein
MNKDVVTHSISLGLNLVVAVAYGFKLSQQQDNIRAQRLMLALFGAGINIQQIAKARREQQFWNRIGGNR